MDDRTLHQLITETARKLWQEAGRPDGNDQAHWYEAMRQVSRMTTLPLVTSPPGHEQPEGPLSGSGENTGKLS
ncbi:DUF2934 domain-containing protein [Metarhizobium album]|uniref:DUF2934 domain-containing protein n=1 Tax=Metarhizobium album TaxID=2182425 RepID=A0A2U2DKY3_9HYPH|nr:DUF2934 domain-containing protein [Rhizobium album]PWE53964.1 DUF2934 domain-containing protein [Rhizobium album]